ncbi:MAG: nucleotidyl transferase AbiEii/AbiGii toxin family protein [Firmicutes bacterium]|nr:nucleotidyl transferase AbiEii/AbiGii toxin family protein [Bacillota bacterium]
MPDIAQSVIDRLRSKSRTSGRTVQLILQLFCQEEFLRRLQRSRHHSNLILKGGLLLYSLSGFTSRPTMDVDFLARRMPADPVIIERVVREIIGTSTGNDYVIFEIKGIESITEFREYNGVRVSLIGCIKNTRTPFHIDMGIGDMIVPMPLERAIPTQLDGFEEPVILTYSLESTVAEKLDAIISRMELNSRMKDFYDLYYLASTYSFDARTLQEALFQTLQHRGTPFDGDSLRKVRQLASMIDVQTRWSRFASSRLGIRISLVEVLDIVYIFLEPVFEAIVNEREIFGTWDPAQRRYVSVSNHS